MHIDKKGSVYYRQLRHSKLMLVLNNIKMAKMHSGGGNAEEHTFPFDKAYNNQRAVEKHGRVRTKEELISQSDIECSAAQTALTQACHNCEFFPCLLEPDEDFSKPEVKEKFLARRRKLFWRCYDDSGPTRERIRSRLAQKEVASGAKSAPCLTLVRPGRLKKTDWTYS